MLKNILLTIVCAGREPIVGAMWFIYVLLFSLIGFCMVSFICRHLTHTESVYTGTRLVVFTFLQLVSCMLTKQFGLTIPRCSNVFSVMLLIFIGQQIFQKYKIQFDNGYLAIISAIFVYQGSLLMGNGMVNLNVNDYSDMMQLTIGSLASLYFLGYISKKIENYMIGIWLNYLGKESFYIMSLHFIGFHLCTEFLIYCKIIGEGKGDGTTPFIDNVLLLLVYFAFGIMVPLLIMSLWRKCWKII